MAQASWASTLLRSCTLPLGLYFFNFLIFIFLQLYLSVCLCLCVSTTFVQMSLESKRKHQIPRKGSYT